MSTPSEPPDNWDQLRERVIGLGESSIRKSYYPELQQRLADLERFRALLDESNDAIFLVELPAGNLTDLNESACVQLGYQREELLGASIAQLVPPDVLGRVSEAFDRERADGIRRQMIVTTLRKRDGVLLPFEITMRLVTFQAIVYAVLVARDISERLRAEAERRALERRLLETQKLESLGVLAGGIAHDFNNLLTVIIGGIDMAAADLPLDSPIRSDMVNIRQATQRAVDLTQQLLAYAGRGHRSTQRLQINALVEEMAGLLAVALSRDVVLRCHLGEDLPDIEADATQIRQVVMNLIVNAAEAIGSSGGTVDLTTGRTLADHAYLATTRFGAGLPEGEYVFLKVVDTGCGMDAVTLGKIFDPFFTTKVTGRGLGLAAVLGIMRSHQGTLDVQSVVGQGTVFTILLPAVSK